MAAMATWDSVKARLRGGSVLLWLIVINVAVFVLLNLGALLGYLAGIDSGTLLSWVEVPSGFGAFLHRPWTALTYMVSHYSFWHVLFNLLWLYWMGAIFLEYFTPKQLGGLYVLGGLGGAALYLLCFNLLPALSSQHVYLIGASASVLAIVTGVACYAPHYRVNLLFIGPVSLKWLAIITVVLVLIGEGSGNPGTFTAHAGGIAVGVAYGLLMRRGHDLTAGINAVIDWVVSLTRKQPRAPKRQPRYHYRPAASPTQPTEAEIDVILDKLKRSGYGALTDQEKATLFRASSRKK